jgi:hypothetical protein
MSMQVTIILRTGGFLVEECKGQTYLDVGYFETPGPWDVEVSGDVKSLQAPDDPKLGKGNQRIEVEHVGSNGIVKFPVNLLDSFKDNILKKDDLYETKDMPDFIASEYDCVLRFRSGDFEGSDVTDRRFTEHSLSDDRPTGNEKSKAIANEILVHFDLGDREVLRLRRANGLDLWSISSDGTETKPVQVKILADESLNSYYHKRALAHKCGHYYLPNSDPPPMNGPSGI